MNVNKKHANSTTNECIWKKLFTMTEVKFEPRIVIPGDSITEVDSVADSAPVVLGPGLYRAGDGERVAANRAGVLRHKRAAQDAVAADVFWVDSHSKR